MRAVSALLLVGGCQVLGDPPEAKVQGGMCRPDVVGALYWTPDAPPVEGDLTLDGALHYAVPVDPGVLEVRVLGVEAAAEGSLHTFSVTIPRSSLDSRVDGAEDHDGDPDTDDVETVTIETIEVVDACGARSVDCEDEPCSVVRLAPPDEPATPAPTTPAPTTPAPTSTN